MGLQTLTNSCGAIPQKCRYHFCFGGACARGGLRPLWRRRLQVLRCRYDGSSGRRTGEQHV